MSVPNFPQFIKALNYFGAAQLRAIQEVVNRKIENLDASDVEPVTLYTESELNARVKAASNSNRLVPASGSQNAKLALAKQQAVYAVATAIDSLESDIHSIINTCGYLVVPGVPLEVLRIQLLPLLHGLDQIARAEGEFIQSHPKLAHIRPQDEWELIDSQVTDIRAGIAALLDEQHSDNGELLRRMLDRHMLPRHKERNEALQRGVEQREQEAQRQREAEKEAAAKEAVKSSHLSETVKIQWETERRIVAAIKPLKDAGRSQIDAARYYLKLLTDRKEGHGKPLSDGEKAEFFYLSGEKSKGDRAFGKQISEIVKKHDKPESGTAN